MEREILAAKNVLQSYLLGCSSLVFAAAFLIVLFLFLSIKSSTENSQSWPSVQGMIKKSELAAAEEASSFRRALIIYNYTVEDEVYTSDRVRINWPQILGYIPPEEQDQQAVNQLLKEFRVNTEVRVYYNPKKPDSSVLLLGLSKPPIRFSLVFYLLLAFTIATAFIAAWKYRSRKDLGNYAKVPKSQ